MTAQPELVPDSVSSRRGRKPGTKAKVHVEIPAEEFNFELVDEDTRGHLRRQRIERSERQIALDAKAREWYGQWLEAGSPTKWNLMPVRGWVIAKSLEEEALFMLGKAARLHDLTLVTGTTQRKPLPGLPLPAGKVRIPFCIVSKNTEVTGIPSEDSESEE